jgi:ubiquinone/menaquinone biosynthesis C-methylase UbiE
MQPSTALVQQQVNEHFAAEASYWAAVYEASRVSSLIYTRRQQIALRWIDQLGLPADSRTLEVGCGAGRLAVALARRGLNVTASDSNPAMIRQAQRYATAPGLRGRLSAQLADAHELPFLDDTFALIVALGVLPWLHSVRAALMEMRRVLRPRGHVILTCDNRLRLDYFLDPRHNLQLRPFRQKLKVPLLRRGIVKETPHLQGNLLSRAQLAALLEEAGFEVLELAPCGYGPYTFFGRPVLPARAGAFVQRMQQQMGEQGTPIVRSCANQYVVLCRKLPRASVCRNRT